MSHLPVVPRSEIEVIELKSVMFEQLKTGIRVPITHDLYREGHGPKIRFTDTQNGYWAAII